MNDVAWWATLLFVGHFVIDLVLIAFGLLASKRIRAWLHHRYCCLRNIENQADYLEQYHTTRRTTTKGFSDS